MFSIRWRLHQVPVEPGYAPKLYHCSDGAIAPELAQRSRDPDASHPHNRLRVMVGGVPDPPVVHDNGAIGES